MTSSKQSAQKILTLFPIFLVLYETATYLSNDMYLPALVRLMHDFHTTKHMAQLTLTAWFLGSMSMQLVLGPLSDRYGRRPVVLLGGVLFVVSCAVTAVTHNLQVFLGARFFQGMTVCSVIVAGYAAIHELFDESRAIKTIALMSAISILAPAFGPLIGALVVTFYHWRWLFAGLAIAGLILVAGLTRVMPESNPPDQRKAFQISALMTDYFAILRNRKFMLVTFTSCGIFAAMIAWLTAGPFLIENTFHESIIWFGVYQCVVFFTYVVGTRWVNRLLPTHGVATVIWVGLALIALGGVTALVIVPMLPRTPWPLVLSLTVISLGTGLSSSSRQRIVIDSADQPMGARMAVFSTVFSAFGVIATLIVSAFYTGSVWSLGIIVGALVLSAVLIYIIESWLDRSGPPRAHQ